MQNRFKLSPPWCTYVNELIALFNEDPDIYVKYVEEQNKVSFYIENDNKYHILSNLLPYYKDFGNIVLKIELIPSNHDPKPDICFSDLGEDDVFNILFKDNPVFSFTKTVEVLFNLPITYVVFTNKVVQFFNDNLSDIYGNMNTLYQNIAEDILGENFTRVFYCTDIPKDYEKFTEQWP